LTSLLSQALRLRMSGDKLLLTLNVVMSCTRTILLLPFVSHTHSRSLTLSLSEV